MIEDVTSAWLVPLSGPSMRPIELSPKDAKRVLGRHDQCDVRLGSDNVSRFHAQLTFEQGRWRIADLKSRWGTFINGQRVAPDTKIPLHPGDMIGISPWTFSFSLEPAGTRGVSSTNDLERNQTMVRSIVPHRPGALAEDRLALLLEVTAAMQNVPTERKLAEVLLDAACRGCGLPNAAVLRPIDAEGRVEVIAAKQTPHNADAYSRSLINAASTGVVAAFVPENDAPASHSIVTMQIDAALCVPLMLGTTVAGYLYLDARDRRAAISSEQWISDSAFCLALGQIASLALANLKRIDVERRAAEVEAELRAAAEAQRWVMPRREVELAPFRCAGESRPGRFVGGDFFDLIPLEDGKLAIAVGDVAGKGSGASIFITAAHGFLNAALQQRAPLENAVAQLSRFLSPRQPGDRFLTLWVGVLDPASHTLRYVDAGHGYAFIHQPGESLRRLDASQDVPIGVTEPTSYTAECVDLPPHGQLLVVSDGLVEQCTPPADSRERGVPFGIEGLCAVAAQSSVSNLRVTDFFEAVTKHAGSSALADDATAVLVRW